MCFVLMVGIFKSSHRCTRGKTNDEYLNISGWLYFVVGMNSLILD